MKKNIKKIEVFFDYEELKKTEPCSKGAWAFRQIFGMDRPFTGSREDVRKFTETRLMQSAFYSHMNSLFSVSADITVTYRDYLRKALQMELSKEDYDIEFNVKNIEAFVDSVYEWLQRIPITLLTERKQNAELTATSQ